MKSILLYVICLLFISGFLIQYSLTFAVTHEEEIVPESIEYEEDQPAEIEESDEDQLIEPDEYGEDQPAEIEESDEDQLIEPGEYGEDQPAEIERY